MRVPEFRKRTCRGISASVGVDDSRGSTRGQLVGRAVEVQVAGDFLNASKPDRLFGRYSDAQREVPDVEGYHLIPWTRIIINRKRNH